MKLKLTILLSLLLLQVSAQTKYPPKSKGEIINHSYYTLAYSEDHEQALWVYYILTPQMTSGVATRTNNFREDKKVSTSSAQLADYKGSGYDRGHLCPAASMSINKIAMSESFLMSNMSPQSPSFNRGIWKKLEEMVRSWVQEESLLHVISAPVLLDGLQTIGINKVAVPKQYYKIIYSPSKQKMIAFLLENKASKLPLESFTVSVDSLEALTGIDFFSALPDSLENRLEANSKNSLWSF